MKSSWSAKTRMSEVVAIETSKERISVLVKDAEFRKPHANGDGLLGCLPTVVWHEDMQDMIAGPRQFMTGYEPRIHRVIVFEMLFPVYELTNVADLMQAYRDIFQGM